MKKTTIGKINMFLGDNMEFMKDIPDKHYDLAIVDPPYGINLAKSTGVLSRYNTQGADWDKAVPGKEYFDELFRVSKNQIIWGGNYFDLPPTREFIFWWKHPQIKDFSEGEFAWTSFTKKARCFDYPYSGFLNRDMIRIHPTQKPVKLYEWLLMNYAQKDFKILDTHFGSCSIGIACHYFGCELDAIEIDEEMYDRAIKRVKEETSQTRLFL